MWVTQVILVLLKGLMFLEEVGHHDRKNEPTICSTELYAS
jgi:hypothetical protein